MMAGTRTDFTLFGATIIQVTEQEYAGGLWDNSTKYLLSYTDGKLSSITQQTWNGNEWDNELSYINLNWHDWNGFLPTSIASTQLQSTFFPWLS